MGNRLLLCLISAVIFLSFSSGDAVLRRNGLCSWKHYKNSTCTRAQFPCLNGKCINRELYCNRVNDCGDNSDENYCENSYECPKIPLMRKCPNSRKCILDEWFCDGIKDCYDGKDEQLCEEFKDTEHIAQNKAIEWLQRQRNSKSATASWGSLVDKSAVAMFLASNTSTESGRATRREMAYEISIQLLSRLAKRKLKDIPSSDLASYVNAFLVTCVDPRKFHGHDIVRELRSRVDSLNHTNPYVLLALCNAGDTITDEDKTKLIDEFRSNRKTFWTDIQAVVVMALACAFRQSGSDADSANLRELTLELKLHQYRNGTVENLQTTALVLQALMSAEPDSDPDNFDEQKALQQLVAGQLPDGSFGGSFASTYFALPVLACRSLVNVSAEHCEATAKDEMSALEDLATRDGPKKRVRYSLWMGNERDLERNLALRVPANMSFYAIMELAAEVDSRYKFEYVVKNRKPYVNALSGLQDDPERGKFWFLYTIAGGKATPSEESPADVMPKNNEHFVMWYRSGTWVDQRLNSSENPEKGDFA